MIVKIRKSILSFYLSNKVVHKNSFTTNIMINSLYVSINIPLLAKCIMYLRIWKGAIASPVLLINAPNPINRNYKLETEAIKAHNRY
jgi:hypothetical protein